MKIRVKQLCFIAMLAIVCIQKSNAQSVLSATRRVDWSKAGYNGTVPTYPQISISNFGADNTGTNSSNAALANAINAVNGNPATIYFPAGNYLFTQSFSLPGNIILKGAGNNQTQLTFNLNGANEDLIKVTGSFSSTTTNLTSSANKGATEVVVNSTADFTPGDYVKLNQADAGLVYSTWASGCIGQFLQIEQISGNTIRFRTALRKNFALANTPIITKINTISGCGIECMKIKRMDATAYQSSTIKLFCATNCWITGIESDSCNYAHVDMDQCSNIKIANSYFHGAFAYGGNGQGYGVVAEGTSGDCLIENNIFKHLRHSMLLQSGANGNVFAYNYSIEPYWSNGIFSPSNSAGDIVLHGNWPYANLFEGNMAQNIMLDNSHGKNGTFNTFFRNRAGTYGINMTSGATDSTNLIGNEVTNTTWGMYNVTGSGNFTYGNAVKGTITPAGTATLNEASLYNAARPWYFTSSHSYPAVGAPNPSGSGIIPAATTFANPTTCNCTTQASATILPIQLQSFAAKASGCDAMLQWVASDDDGDQYVIEKSLDGTHFSAERTLNAAGKSTTHTYQVLLSQSEASAWYRLKMINRDGGTAYSQVAAVKLSCRTGQLIAIYPNPASSFFYVKFQGTKEASIALKIMNLSGVVVQTQLLPLQSGENNVQFNIQKLSTGIYYVQLQDASGNVLGSIQKLIKL